MILAAMLLMLAGLFCLADASWFVSAFEKITVIYGIGALVAGLFKIQWAINSLRRHNSEWYFLAFAAIISLIGAIIILVNPFTSSSTTWIFAGCILILMALCDVFASIREAGMRGRRKKKIRRKRKIIN